jgi:hypothetical protein
LRRRGKENEQPSDAKKAPEQAINHLQIAMSMVQYLEEHRPGSASPVYDKTVHLLKDHLGKQPEPTHEGNRERETGREAQLEKQSGVIRKIIFKASQAIKGQGKR